MIKKNILLVFSLLLIFQVSAQELSNFEHLECKGPIPKLFVTYLNDKIASDREKMESDDNITKTNARDFSAISNYKLQQLIRSGRLLYGDPLTVYANKVLEKLKKASKDDLSQVAVYTLKSNEVNAFATPQGIIYITVGLWGQIENESQLAFILAHEITHILEKHGQVRYQYSKHMIKKGKFGNENLSELFKYTKEHELEADKAGVKLATSAGYDANALLGTYQVLLYSYLPIDEMPVNYTWLENEKFKVTEKYIKKELKPISAEEDEEDEFRTHPNVKNRKSAVEGIIKSLKNNEGLTYQCGTEAEFKKVQDLARFEMMNIYIRNAQYISGLYHNLVLSQKYPNNDFLAKTAAMTWYGSVKFKNNRGSKNDDDEEEESNEVKKEGEIQQLYFFFSKLNKKYLNCLAVKEVWEASLLFPKDTFLITIRERVLTEFIKSKSGSIEDFATSFDTTETVVVPDPNKPKTQSKYDKISKKKAKSNSDEFIKYAWVEILKSNEFKGSYEKSETALEKEKKDEDDDDENESGKIQESKLNIKNLALVAPNYYKNDLRKNVNTNVSKADMNESLLIEMVNKNADLLGIKMHTIDNFNDPNFDTEAYNNFSLLYDYLGERTQYNDLNFYPFYAQYMPKLSEAFGSSHIAMFNIYTEIDKRKFNGGAFLLSLVTVYPFPFYLVWQFTIDKRTEYGFLVYNIETHNPTYISNKNFSNKMGIQVQDAHIYNSLNQITRKK
jgi:hypothetical protein